MFVHTIGQQGKGKSKLPPIAGAVLLSVLIGVTTGRLVLLSSQAAASTNSSDPVGSPRYTVEEITQPERSQGTVASGFSTTGHVAGLAYVLDYPKLRPIGPQAPGAKRRDGNTGRAYFDKDREYSQDNIDLLGFAFLLLNPKAIVDFYKRDIYEGYRVGDVGQRGGRITANSRAFVTDGKRARLLPAPGQSSAGRNFLGGQGVTALGVNKHGWAVGTYPPIPDFPDTTRAFMFRPEKNNGAGESVDLGTLGGTNSVAFAISDTGLVVGDAEITGGIVRAFVYNTQQAGRMTDLGTLGGVESHARYINERGQIAGWAHTKEQATRACVWEDGKAYALPQPENTIASFAAYIAANGRVAGRVETAPNRFEAALWDSPVSPCRLLGTLGGTSSEAVSVNSRGEVVGMSDLPVQPPAPSTNPANKTATTDKNKPPSIVRHPFVWRGGKMYDLVTSLVPGSKWEVVGVASISDNGVIAAIAQKGKETRAVLLRPAE